MPVVCNSGLEETTLSDGGNSAADTVLVEENGGRVDREERLGSKEHG